MIVTNIDIFPPEHRAKLKEILYDLAEVHRQVRDSHVTMTLQHQLDVDEATKSRKIDFWTFKTVELYRVQIDHVNSYTKYLVDNDLIKYISNA